MSPIPEDPIRFGGVIVITESNLDYLLPFKQWWDAEQEFRRKQDMDLRSNYNASELTGRHPDIIIRDMPPTKLQVFLRKINVFRNKNSERERVYKWNKKTKN